jgi:hypothetical protein
MAEQFTDAYGDERWELSEDEYKLLKLKAEKYDALIEFGVSNWEGYDEAMIQANEMAYEDDDDFEEDEDEEEDDEDEDYDDDDDDLDNEVEEEGDSE